jgi:hypothetical protein
MIRTWFDSRRGSQSRQIHIIEAPARSLIANSIENRVGVDSARMIRNRDFKSSQSSVGSSHGGMA